MNALDYWTNHSIRGFSNYSLKSLFTLVLLLGVSSLFAQWELSKKDELQFHEALELMKGFKNDKAIVILQELSATIKDKGQTASPIGLNVNLRLGEAFERDDQDEEAFKRINEVLDLSLEKKVWNVSSEACISLARMHEKMGRKENCYRFLQQTDELIKKHKLDSIGPRFSIRMSSYHRIFENQDSALFYANQALVLSKQFNQPDLEGTAHLLLGMLLGASDYKKSIKHYQKAGYLWKQLGDITGYSYTLSNLSRIHYRNHNLKKALLYNDSTIIAGFKSNEEGHEDKHVLFSAFSFRSQIYKDKQMYDSAYIYLKKSYDIELAQVYKSNREKVIAIDAKYQDDKKRAEILKQKKMLESEADRRVKLKIYIATILLLLFLLALAYYRLFMANIKSKEQANVIGSVNKKLSKSLDRQIILKSELNHRVKNNLQIIISLLELQNEEIEAIDVKENLNDISQRIQSIATMHELLSGKQENGSLNIKSYIEKLANSFTGLSGNEKDYFVDIDVEDGLDFNMATSMPLGLILNELLTNSLKYAKRENEDLKISIALQRAGPGFGLTYRDNGPGFSMGEFVRREEGLGAYLVKSMIRQIEGSLKSYNDSGAVVEIFFKEKNKNI